MPETFPYQWLRSVSKMTAATGVTRLDRAGHFIALPASASIQALALAWYPQARWVREPVTGGAATAQLTAPRGARFRGLSLVAAAEPGELELEPGVLVTGPTPLTEERCWSLGLTASRVDGFDLRVEGADEAGRTERADRAHRWLVAAARHARGAVLAEGATVQLPLDLRRSVNRHLFSAHALRPEVALALVRTVLPQAALESRAPEATGPQDFEIITHTPYDGSVVLRCERADRLPPALHTLPWRDSGPFRYAVQWLAGDAYPADEEDAHHVHQIARRRMAPVVIAVVSALYAAVAGTVLDDDGFICADPPAVP